MSREVTPEANQCRQATAAELKEARRRCFRPACTRRAWLEDWDGWRWCVRDWLRNLRWSGGNVESKWLKIRHVKLYWWKP